MAKSKVDKDDIKRLVENTSNPSSTSSVYSAKYVEDNFLSGVASDFATSSQGEKADTAIQGVKVNDTELTPDSDKKVNIQVPTTVAELSDSNEYAHLEGGKILEGNLPDYIFGQVLFGGFVAYNSTNDNIVCTLSSKFKSKYNITANTLILGDMLASDYEGVYFIATTAFSANIDFEKGDWLISNGSYWSKVANTDAVVSVNGQIGAVVLTPADVGAAPNSHNHDYGSLNNLPEIISMEEQIANNNSLEDVQGTGIYPLVYGYKYYSVPSKVCGTVGERDDLEGFLIVYSSERRISQQIHDTINNKFYIRSYYTQNSKWNYWEKIITCKASSGEQGRSPEVTEKGFDLDEQDTPVNTFYNIDTSQHSKDLNINISLENVNNYLIDNGPGAGEFKITLMFSSPIDNPALVFSVPSPSVVGTTYTVNGTDPSVHSNISGLEIIIKWYDMGWGILFAVYKVNIL